MTPPSQAIDELNRMTLARHSWLANAGPIARRLVQEAERENQSTTKGREAGQQSPEQQ